MSFSEPPGMGGVGVSDFEREQSMVRDLFAAARNNNEREARAILDQGVDVNVRDIDDHTSPLHCAALTAAKQA